MALKKNPKYDLKLKYQRTLEICLIISLGLLIGAFKLFPTFGKTDVILDAPQELIDVEDVEATKQEAPPPPPPKPPIPIEAPSDDVLEDIEIQETELDIDEVVEAPPPPVEEEEEEVEPVFFVAVEEQPEPIGGMQALQKKLNYPVIAQRAGVQGRVFVKAYVDENGDVKDVEIVKGIGAGCDEEAMRVVRETKFKPGRQRGKPVKVQVTVRIVFTLRGN